MVLATERKRFAQGSVAAGLGFGLAGASAKTRGVTRNPGSEMPVPASLDDSEPVPSRKPETDIGYEKGGQKLLERAMRLFPNASDPVEAFSQLCDDPKWILRPSTTRSYKARVIKCIEGEVAAGRCDYQSAIEGIERTAELLNRRRGNPEARTSRLKCMDVTKEESQLIADDLRTRVSIKRDIVNEVLLLFVQVAPCFGLRPCEWQSTRIVARTLVVLNAKSSNERAPGSNRCISLERASEQTVLGIERLIEMIGTLVERHGSWEKVHGILAERLARICRRLRLVRISLYSLRHAAIATWKKAKLGRIEIAALAGHISIKTASRHYAPAKHGWDPKFLRVKASRQTVAVVNEHLDARSAFKIPKPWSPPVDWSVPSPAMSP